MSIEAVFERIAVALERIADGARNVETSTPDGVVIPGPGGTSLSVPSQAAEAPKKRGRPPKAAAPAPAPAPEPTPEPTPAPAPEPAPAPTPEADDDFLGAEAPKKEYAIEDVRAALVKYAGASSQQTARDALKELSGVDALSKFTDKSKYADFVAEIEKRTAKAPSI